MIEAKPFIEILKRANKSRYKTLIMQNRMLMQCYNLDVDSSVGLHYILMIPDTPDYDDEFYNMELVINPDDIIKQYTEAHKIAETARKELKAKPKEMDEELYIDEHKKHVHLKFIYLVSGELVASAEIDVQKVDPISVDITNLEKTYDNLIERVKAGGAALTYDGLYENLQNRILECPEIYLYKVRMGKTVIRVPFSKSIFVGLTKLAKFTFTIVETELPDIYVYAIVFGKNDIEEVFWGYLLNY